VVGRQDEPGSELRVSSIEHDVAGARVLEPPAARRQVHRAELPLTERICNSRFKSPLLLLVADFEPDLDQLDTPGHDVVFELWAKLEKSAVLVFRAKTHDVFDARAVVPTAVENDHFAFRRKVLHVALEIDLALLTIGRSGQRHHAKNTGAHAFR